MAKQTAFDRFFADPVSFTEGYGSAVSALAYTKEQARDIFQENEMGDHHDYVVKLEEIGSEFVRWHGGINDDGQTGNMWFIGEEEGKRGAKPVWTFQADWHLINKGHKYEHVANHWNRCFVCDPPSQASGQAA